MGTTSMFKLMVAGGGTGGHLFPGIAVAEEFIERGEAEVLFVGTGRPVEVDILRKRALNTRAITAAGFKGKGLGGRLKSMVSLPVGLFQSMGLIRKFRPNLVLGVGGYVSGPVGLAARIMGVPSAIHEQNSIPGAANKILGRIVDQVFISFESSSDHFPAKKCVLTGNPIRKEILEASGQKKNGTGSNLVVVGGSLGAAAVNLAVVEAVKILHRDKQAVFPIHQTGSADREMVRKAYEDLGIEARVAPFFDDMADVYRAADLVVCRAGALTVSEVAAMGVPAIFIPLPTAANNHQEENARWLERAGAAEVILQKDLTPDGLAAAIRDLFNNPEKLAEMSEAARRAALTGATQKICDLCRARAPRG